QLEYCAANVNRVHLLVLPCPDQSVPHQLLDIIGNRHSAQAADDHLLAIGDTDNLFTLQAQKQQVDDFTSGIAAVHSAPALEIAHELIVDLAHAAPPFGVIHSAELGVHK